jgi:hypothetical protein
MRRISEIIKIWKNDLQNKKFISYLVITLIMMLLVSILVPKYLIYNEMREGYTIKDPILSLFNPIDVTWITFIIMYSAIPLTLFALLKYPIKVVFAFNFYVILITLRVTCMFLLPLNPPSTILILQDPFIAFFSTGKTFTKDLFFSGHTATMFLMFLSVEQKVIKYILLLFTILIGVLVLVQHVHYTIDVFAAPFFTYIAYLTAKKIQNKFC